MKCPVCSSNLVEIKFKSAFVDICPRCKGTWFDSDELVDFVRTLTESEEISPQIPQLFNERIVKTLNSVKENKDKVCPRCNQKLKVFNYAYDSNVFLDKCPHCQGMWADEGEAKKLARYLKEDPRITSIAKSFIKKDRAMQDSQDLAKISRTLTRSANPVVLSIPKMIIPLSDDTPRQRVPLVTIFIMILCVLIFIGQVFFIRDPFAFVQKFGLIPAHFLGIGLISSMFLHGGLLHLIGNMFFLWLFVSNVEDRFSRFGFLVFYLCCGLSANILHSFLNWNLSIPTMGASGAISGIMGAYFIFYPKARINIFVIYKILRVPAFLYLGVWVLFQLMFGFTFKTTGVSNIAWFAHIGGFIFGGLFAYFKKKAVIIKG